MAFLGGRFPEATLPPENRLNFNFSYSDKHMGLWALSCTAGGRAIWYKLSVLEALKLCTTSDPAIPLLGRCLLTVRPAEAGLCHDHLLVPTTEHRGEHSTDNYGLICFGGVTPLRLWNPSGATHSGTCDPLQVWIPALTGPGMGTWPKEAPSEFSLRPANDAAFQWLNSEIYSVSYTLSVCGVYLVLAFWTPSFWKVYL